MSANPWCLYKTKGDVWKRVASFASLAEAAERIRNLERISVDGLFLEVFIEPDASDDAVCSLFQYSGSDVAYAIRREYGHGLN